MNIPFDGRNEPEETLAFLLAETKRLRARNLELTFEVTAARDFSEKHATELQRLLLSLVSAVNDPGMTLGMLRILAKSAAELATEDMTATVKRYRLRGWIL